MKNIKTFRVLAVVFTLVLLLVGIPASPVLAADIELNPDEGEIGDRVRVTEGEFTANTTAKIYFSSQEADTGDDIDDEVTAYELLETTTTGEYNGELYIYIYIPERLTDGDDDENVHSGTYYVYVTTGTSKRIRDVAEFTVIAGEIEIDPDEGVVGTEVEVSGSGFAGGEEITVEYDGRDIDIESGDDETDGDGEFQFTIIIPESTAGDHTITVMDESGSESEATFTVEPRITIEPKSGGAGTTVEVSGTGFGDELEISIWFGDVEVATAETDDDGSFTATFKAPALQPAKYDVEAWDEDDNSSDAEFTISLSADINPVTSAASPGHVGTELTVSGIGFTIGGAITVKYDTAQVAVTTADANGAFSAKFAVPKSKGGTHTVSVSDGVNTEQFTFVMESEKPPIPAPEKPEMGIKAEPLTFFDWRDVTDPSGVTYTLQIASENFTSIVLEKTGLTKSEYTIIEAEKLEPTSKEAPYYWRVKAIDGASNESGWSGVGSFYYTSFSLGLPQWAIYVLIGVGALILAIVGFWLGRKTAYY